MVAGGIPSQVAQLTGEPWGLPIEEASRVSFRQYQTVYLHPRDKRGRVVPQYVDEKPADEKAMFTDAMTRRGLPHYRIADLWREHCRRSAEAMKRRRRG
jgi:hypothetical protein